MTALAHPSARGTVVALVGVALVVGGAVSGFVDVIRAGIFVLALVLLALVLVAVQTSRTRRLDVVRSGATSQLHAGADTRVTLRIAGRRSRLALTDLVEETSFTPRSPVTWPLDTSRTDDVVGYDAHAPRRGEYACGPAALVVTDPLGLARSRRPVGARTTYLVWPRIHEVEADVASAPGDGDDTIASIHATHAGRPGASIRPYVQGDDLRTVHWPATAHRGEMMVRQFDPPAEPRTHVVVAGAVSPAGVDAEWEHLLTEAASTCTYLDLRAVPMAVTVGDVRAERLEDAMDALARAGVCEAPDDATSEDNTTFLFLHTSTRARPAPPLRSPALAWVNGPQADEAVTTLQALGWDARLLSLPRGEQDSTIRAARPAGPASSRTARAAEGAR